MVSLNLPTYELRGGSIPGGLQTLAFSNTSWQRSSAWAHLLPWAWLGKQAHRSWGTGFLTRREEFSQITSAAQLVPSSLPWKCIQSKQQLSQKETYFYPVVLKDKDPICNYKSKVEQNRAYKPYLCKYLGVLFKKEQNVFSCFFPSSSFLLACLPPCLLSFILRAFVILQPCWNLSNKNIISWPCCQNKCIL